VDLDVNLTQAPAGQPLKKCLFNNPESIIEFDVEML